MARFPNPKGAIYWVCGVGGRFLYVVCCHNAFSSFDKSDGTRKLMQGVLQPDTSKGEREKG